MLAPKLLQLADGVMRNPQGIMVDRWPRAAAALGRQAIEDAMKAFWLQTEPSIADASMRAQLLSLPVYFADEEMAELVSSTWAALSRACHYHPYELPPTQEELDGLLSVARRLVAAVQQQGRFAKWA